MDTPFFDYLVDDFGIWQHCNGQAIYKNEGYALDDAARGLIVCLALGKRDLAETLFQYILRSWRNNGFYGFASSKRKFRIFPASEDATGEVFWALGYACSINFHKTEANRLSHQLKTVINNFSSVRGYAYALLGAVYIDNDLAKALAAKLISFFDNTNQTWLWPELVMTYGNGIIPYALLRYAYLSKDTNVAKFSLNVLKFLNDQCQKNRQLAPIGNKGWLKKDQTKAATYSQQPIDAAYMIWAWLAAYQYFNRSTDYRSVKRWLGWFEGRNIKSKPMYDQATLKCFDGIDKDGINLDSGAESNICLLLSLYMIETKHTI